MLQYKTVLVIFSRKQNQRIFPVIRRGRLSSWSTWSQGLRLIKIFHMLRGQESCSYSAIEARSPKKTLRAEAQNLQPHWSQDLYVKAKGGGCREHAYSGRLMTGQVWLPFLPFPSTLALACHPHSDISPTSIRVTSTKFNDTRASLFSISSQKIQKRASPILYTSLSPETAKISYLNNNQTWEITEFCLLEIQCLFIFSM